jgi:hypothetical protein
MPHWLAECHIKWRTGNVARSVVIVQWTAQRSAVFHCIKCGSTCVSLPSVACRLDLSWFSHPLHNLFWGSLYIKRKALVDSQTFRTSCLPAAPWRMLPIYLARIALHLGEWGLARWTHAARPEVKWSCETGVLTAVWMRVRVFWDLDVVRLAECWVFENRLPRIVLGRYRKGIRTLIVSTRGYYCN